MAGRPRGSPVTRVGPWRDEVRRKRDPRWAGRAVVVAPRTNCWLPSISSAVSSGEPKTGSGGRLSTFDSRWSPISLVVLARFAGRRRRHRRVRP